MSLDNTTKESYSYIQTYSDQGNKINSHNKRLRFSPIDHLVSSPTPKQKIKRIVSSTPGSRAFSFDPNSKKNMPLSTKTHTKELLEGSKIKKCSPLGKIRLKRNRNSSRCYSSENETYGFLFRTMQSKLDENCSKGVLGIQATSPFFKAKLELSNKNYQNAVDVLESVKSSRKNIDCIFLRAVGYIKLEKYEKALKDFQIVQASKKVTSPSLFLYMFDCFNNLGNFDEALKTLNLCVKNFPHHLTGYFMRGKFLVEQSKIDEAISDLKKIKHPEAFLLLYKCWKIKRHYDNALKYLEKYRKLSKSSGKFLIEFGKLNYKFEKFEDALKCFEALMKHEANNPELLYYLSKCKIIHGDLEDAELMLEKVAHTSLDDKLITKSIYKLADIKVQQGDFYGAFSTLKRQKSPLKSIKKRSQNSFIEAMFNITQNEFEASILAFNDLLKEKNSDDLQYKCYIYRAFAYFSIRNYELSESDYKSAKNMNELDKASEFNYLISSAMCLFISKDYEKSLKILNSGFFSEFSNLMPQYLKVLCQIFIISDGSYDFSDAFNTFSTIKCKSDSEYFLLTAFFSYFDKDYKTSLSTITISIKKSEKSSFSAYTLSGFCNVALKNFSEALDDFNIALSMNKNFLCLYPYRGLCAYFTGSYKEAAKDFLKIYQKGDMNATLLSIYLLIVTKNTSEALKLINSVEESTEILVLKAHCMLLKENYDECIECLERICNEDVKNDIFIIKNLSKGIIKAEGAGPIFNEKYVTWLEAVDKMYNKDYDSAIELFELLIKMINKLQKKLLFRSNTIIDQERNELMYNLALCYMMKCDKESLEKAIIILSKIEGEMEEIHSIDLTLLLAIVQIGIGNFENGNMYLQKVAKFNSDLSDLFKENQEVIVYPLNTGNEFSRKFDLIELPDNCNIKCRPAIRLPRLQPPLDLTDSCEILLKMIKAENIDVRPEIPWLVKLNDRYIFTENLIDDIESRRSEGNFTDKSELICKSNQYISSVISF